MTADLLGNQDSLVSTGFLKWKDRCDQPVSNGIHIHDNTRTIPITYTLLIKHGTRTVTPSTISDPEAPEQTKIHSSILSHPQASPHPKPLGRNKSAAAAEQV